MSMGIPKNEIVVSLDFSLFKIWSNGVLTLRGDTMQLIKMKFVVKKQSTHSLSHTKFHTDWWRGEYGSPKLKI